MTYALFFYCMQKYIFFRDPIDSSMLNIVFSRERDLTIPINLFTGLAPGRFRGYYSMISSFLNTFAICSIE